MRQLRLLLPALPLLLAGCATGAAPRQQPPPAAAATTAAAAAVNSGRPTSPMTTVAVRDDARGRSAAGRPCRGTQPPAAYSHVVVVWMENASYADVVGAPRSWPWLDGTLLPRCGLLTGYRASGHPSLGNYLTATSGTARGLGATTDCGPRQCPQAQPSVFSALDRAHRSWRSYAEGMPAPCTVDSSGFYATKHVPALYYRDVARDCPTHVLPLTAFDRDLAAGRLPAYAVVTPDECHDGHSCPAAAADAWLRSFVGRLTAGADYRRGDTALLVVWDEGERSGAEGLHVPLVLVAPSVPAGLRVATPAGHVDQLHLVQGLLRLPGGRPGIARAAHLAR